MGAFFEFTESLGVGVIGGGEVEPAVLPMAQRWAFEDHCRSP